MNKQQQAPQSIYNRIIAAMCVCCFLLGAAFSASAFSQTPANTTTDAPTQGSLRSEQPVVLETPATQVYQAAQDQPLLRAIELTHATVFAILALNLFAVILFFAIRFWPRRTQTASKKMVVNDTIRIDRRTTLFLLQIHDREHLVVLGPNGQTVTPLAAVQAPDTTQTPFSGEHSVTKTSPRPSSDDEAVSAAVRSMLTTQ